VPPRPEPLTGQVTAWYPDIGFSHGESHKFLTSRTGSAGEEQGIFEKAYDTFDDDARWDLQRELGNWLFDNAMGMGLYYANTIFVLGPEVGDWGDHLSRGDPRRISGMEWAPHR
jgi:ABC-type transport system substrate-binding protein